VYARVVEELTAGNKRTHWMWFIFPQIAGLGHSTMAERYAIRDLDQAKRYLDDPTLGERLRHDVRLMLGHAGKSALQILGSPDDLKFRSCLTLFARAASNDDDRCLFKQALDQFGNSPSSISLPRIISRISSAVMSPRNRSAFGSATASFTALIRGCRKLTISRAIRAAFCNALSTIRKIAEPA